MVWEEGKRGRRKGGGGGKSDLTWLRRGRVTKRRNFLETESRDKRYCADDMKRLKGDNPLKKE